MFMLSFRRGTENVFTINQNYVGILLFEILNKIKSYIFHSTAIYIGILTRLTILSGVRV